MRRSEEPGWAKVRKATAAMPTRGEEKLRSTEATWGSGSSWLWVTLMVRGLCWHDSSYVPVRQGKERSD